MYYILLKQFFCNFVYSFFRGEVLIMIDYLCYITVLEKFKQDSVKIVSYGFSICANEMWSGHLVILDKIFAS